MKFEQVPVVSTMLDLYSKPRSKERFQEYLALLQGDKKGDLTLPIGSFNPMAKEHVVQKLVELRALRAEQIIQDTLEDINKTVTGEDPRVFRVSLNLADDLKGGWTNSYTTDYDSKFKINALVTRALCTPYFWTREQYTESLIRSRTFEYAFRTIYWLNKPKPETLNDHVDQEIYVAEQSNPTADTIDANEFERLDNFYQKYQTSTDYHIIFNFFYGDEACRSLEFATFGVDGEANGFDYATRRRFPKP